VVVGAAVEAEGVTVLGAGDDDEEVVAGTVELARTLTVESSRRAENRVGTNVPRQLDRSSNARDLCSRRRTEVGGTMEMI
jgi:hypothetical protein